MPNYKSKNFQKRKKGKFVKMYTQPFNPHFNQEKVSGNRSLGNRSLEKPLIEFLAKIYDGILSSFQFSEVIRISINHFRNNPFGKEYIKDFNHQYGILHQIFHSHIKYAPKHTFETLIEYPLYSIEFELINGKMERINRLSYPKDIGKLNCKLERTSYQFLRVIRQVKEIYNKLNKGVDKL